MSSTIRSLKGPVTKRNDAAIKWLQDSIRALANIQAKESAKRIKTWERDHRTGGGPPGQIQRKDLGNNNEATRAQDTAGRSPGGQYRD
ncbi:unnamed protein product [Cylicocyclus nassatus]|uniref:Uncharacterized protein n=1 Tax=Cylicocyclus nassatus TaxID=53992 RepID=A0AA36M003_CYLNA|nr:unnamed protein product [Cylicocyclus nassatus]